MFLENYRCIIQNAIVVGGLSAFIGYISMSLLDIGNKKSIVKTILIFFSIGIIVHILLEYFNFNQLCCDNKCKIL
jgi:membrane-bound metal-dependent hydrolase YbcI (DUF457 family)